MQQPDNSSSHGWTSCFCFTVVWRTHLRYSNNFKKTFWPIYVLQNEGQAAAHNWAGVGEVYSKACFLTTASVLEYHHSLFNIFQNRGRQKYRYSNISRYFAAQYNIDFSTPNIDISPKSDSAVRRVYFCSRESGWGLCKMDGKLTTPLQFKVDIWKHFGFKVKRDSKNNVLHRDLSIVIRIVSWGSCQYPPLFQTMNITYISLIYASIDLRSKIFSFFIF